MSAIGRELGRLHALGIIHGDLTTSNMMMRLTPGIGKGYEIVSQLHTGLSWIMLGDARSDEERGLTGRYSSISVSRRPAATPNTTLSTSTCWKEPSHPLILPLRVCMPGCWKPTRLRWAQRNGSLSSSSSKMVCVSCGKMLKADCQYGVAVGSAI